MTTLPDGHYIDDAPYDPDENLSALDRKDMDAPAWLLVWRRFRRHKLGLIAGLFLLLSYLLLPVAGFIAPYTPNERSAEYLYHPPQGIHLFHDGSLIGPFVYPTTGQADLSNFRWQYETDTTRPMRLQMFCEGGDYRLLGFIPCSARHKGPPCSCSGPTGWAATCSAASCTARNCR